MTFPLVVLQCLCTMLSEKCEFSHDDISQYFDLQYFDMVSQYLNKSIKIGILLLCQDIETVLIPKYRSNLVMKLCR